MTTGKEVLSEVKKYVKVEVDLQGLVSDVVVSKVIEPQLVKLVAKIKEAIPTNIDDAILDNLMAKELPILKEELKQELAKLEEKIKNAI